MLRLWIALAACVFALDAAPIMTNHPLDLLAEADALIVGRVASVAQGAEVFPPDGHVWQHRVFEHVADIEILRFHAPDRELREQFDAQSRVRIAYRAENPLDQGGVFGGPLWPAIRVGEVRVFGVRNGHEGLRLWFEEGMGAVPPAQETLLLDLPATDGTAFLERELVNGLASSDPTAAFEAARYAGAAFLGWHDSVKNRRPSLEQRLTEMLADDLSRTRMAVAALVASQGSPRPSLSALRAGRPPEGSTLKTYQWLLMSALRLLPEETADSLIIETLLDNFPAFHWSAVVSEYTHHPALATPLAAAIAQCKPGVLPLLEALIRNGRIDLTPSALTLLREHLAHPDLPAADWHAAGRLVLNHGSDQDFALFVELILRARAGSPELYRALWNAAAYDENATRPRMLRLLTIFLYDDREAFSGLRYCEIAAHRLTAISGDRFGLDPHRRLVDTPVSERNEAVQRAKAWLQSHLAQ